VLRERCLRPRTSEDHPWTPTEAPECTGYRTLPFRSPPTAAANECQSARESLQRSWVVSLPYFVYEHSMQTAANVHRRIPPIVLDNNNEYRKELMLLPSEYNNAACDFMHFLMNSNESTLELELSVETVRIHVHRGGLPVTRGRPPSWYAYIKEPMDDVETCIVNDISGMIDAMKDLALRTVAANSEIDKVAILETSACSFARALMDTRLLDGDLADIWKTKHRLLTLMSDVARMIDDVDRVWQLRDAVEENNDGSYVPT